MSKHAPFEGLPGRGYGQLNGLAIRDQRGFVVAVVIGDVPEIDTDGIAKMMCAAPDLLEMAKWAEAAIAPFSKEPAEKSGIARLRAAIAKAEGK